MQRFQVLRKAKYKLVSKSSTFEIVSKMKSKRRNRVFDPHRCPLERGEETILYSPFLSDLQSILQCRPSSQLLPLSSKKKRGFFQYQFPVKFMKKIMIVRLFLAVSMLNKFGSE